MNFDDAWSKIICELSENPRDILTITSNNRAPLYFYAVYKNNRLLVDQAKGKQPSSRMTSPRSISKGEFSQVYSKYNNDIMRSQLPGKNSSYILGIIHEILDHYTTTQEFI